VVGEDCCRTELVSLLGLVKWDSIEGKPRIKLKGNPTNWPGKEIEGGQYNSIGDGLLRGGNSHLHRMKLNEKAFRAQKRRSG